jgi:hypothetical protein
MKPVIAIASIALGSASMATVAYIDSNPTAFLSDTPRYHRSIEGPIQVRNPSRIREAEAPLATQIAPIRVALPRPPRIASTNRKPSGGEPALKACSDWRPLGPSSTDSGVGSGEHRVRLLCPTGATAEETFMAEARLLPTETRLNDWSRMRRE